MVSKSQKVEPEAGPTFTDWCNRPQIQMTCLERVAMELAQSVMADGPADTEGSGYKEQVDIAYKAAVTLLMTSFKISKEPKVLGEFI